MQGRLIASTVSDEAATLPDRQNHGLREILEERFPGIRLLPTSGATACLYGITDIAGQPAFVKIGEKVGDQVEKQSRLRELGVAVVQQVLPGSCGADQILVTDCLSDPNLGIAAADGLRKGELEIDRFLAFQAEAFGALGELYNRPVGPDNYAGSALFEIRAGERLKKLDASTAAVAGRDEWDHTERSIAVRELLDSPITYVSGSASHNLPGLRGMAGFLQDAMRGILEVSPRIVHGDFHPPNVAGDRGNIALIDLSDLRFKEDPCWDLGKWLNFVERFGRVADLRDHPGSSGDFILEFGESGRAVVTDCRPAALDCGLIRTEAVKLFSANAGVMPDLAEVRGRAAEFVVNLSTLERHAERYPHTGPAVLACICDSFIELKRALRTYGKIHS